jgi:hypothetical protein
MNEMNSNPKQQEQLESSLLEIEFFLDREAMKLSHKETQQLIHRVKILLTEIDRESRLRDQRNNQMEAGDVERVLVFVERKSPEYLEQNEEIMKEEEEEEVEQNNIQQQQMISMREKEELDNKNLEYYLKMKLSLNE